MTYNVMMGTLNPTNSPTASKRGWVGRLGPYVYGTNNYLTCVQKYTCKVLLSVFSEIQKFQFPEMMPSEYG